MVNELIHQLKAEGIGIFLISHDIHDVMGLCGRVSVMKNGKLVGTKNVADVTDCEILVMIILGNSRETNHLIVEYTPHNSPNTSCFRRSLFMTCTRAAVISGSDSACPDIGTNFNSAFGIAFATFHADVGGQIIS